MAGDLVNLPYRPDSKTTPYPCTRPSYVYIPYTACSVDLTAFRLSAGKKRRCRCIIGLIQPSLLPILPGRSTPSALVVTMDSFDDRMPCPVAACAVS